MTIDPIILIILSIRWAANQIEDWEQSVALHARVADLIWRPETTTCPLCGEPIDANRICDEDCPVGAVRKLSDPPVRVEP